MATVAVLLTDDFEDVEFTHPRDALLAAGHEIEVLGPKAGEVITGKRGDATTEVARLPGEVPTGSFDALLIPGGYSPDQLRIDEASVAFAKEMMRTGKPVAAICHAGQLLVEAGVVRDRAMTSWPSVRTELELAGADWSDEEVVVDDNLITSRKPDDLDAFSRTLVDRLADN